jgi:hypothetical protein
MAGRRPLWPFPLASSLAGPPGVGRTDSAASEKVAETLLRDIEGRRRAGPVGTLALWQSLLFSSVASHRDSGSMVEDIEGETRGIVLGIGEIPFAAAGTPAEGGFGIRRVDSGVGEQREKGRARKVFAREDAGRGSHLGTASAGMA